MVSAFTLSAEPASRELQPAAATAMLLEDGRLHLHHGPIDLVIGAEGPKDTVNHAFDVAIARFKTILDELVSELDLLRLPLCQTNCRPDGDVAGRMWAATACHAKHYKRDNYVTAMSAVAGAVADEILTLMCNSVDLERAYVNNGGDIALFLNPKAASLQQFSIGICADPDIAFCSFDNNLASAEIPRPRWLNNFAGTIEVTAADKVGGIATSGWKGRSHSLGIADLVTVLASTAAAADVAATLIANAVSPDDETGPDWHGVQRQPAETLSPDSDLGSRLVTVSVASLPNDTIRNALQRGADVAERMYQSGKILTAFGVLQGYGFHCGAVPEKTRRMLHSALKARMIEG